MATQDEDGRFFRPLSFFRDGVEDVCECRILVLGQVLNKLENIDLQYDALEDPGRA
jgi:hypothetical protein